MSTNSGIKGIVAYVAGLAQKVIGPAVARAVAYAAPVTWAGGTGASTLLAAMLFPGACVQRTGATGAFAETLDTAANIIAAYPEIEIGETYTVKYTGVAAYASTITTATGITLTGIVINAGTYATTVLYITKTSETTLAIRCSNS